MGGKQSKTNKSKTKPTVTEQLEYCFQSLQDKNSELRRTQSELESTQSELQRIKSELEKDTEHITPNTKSLKKIPKSTRTCARPQSSTKNGRLVTRSIYGVTAGKRNTRKTIYY
jgi:chromosome segregation ATPase